METLARYLMIAGIALFLLGGGMLAVGLWYGGVSWPVGGKENYYAVYLESGDVYFGYVSHFPRLTLRGAPSYKRE